MAPEDAKKSFQQDLIVKQDLRASKGYWQMFHSVKYVTFVKRSNTEMIIRPMGFQFIFFLEPFGGNFDYFFTCLLARLSPRLRGYFTEESDTWLVKSQGYTLWV